MTLTFDPLTLNFCGTSGITCSNSVLYVSEIEESVAELAHFRRPVLGGGALISSYMSANRADCSMSLCPKEQCNKTIMRSLVIMNSTSFTVLKKHEGDSNVQGKDEKSSSWQHKVDISGL